MIQDLLHSIRSAFKRDVRSARLQRSARAPVALQAEHFEDRTLLSLNGYRVVLDPGHGERPPGGNYLTEVGNTGCWTGVPERTRTLQIAEAVQSHLVRMGFEVYLTRDQYDVSESGRVRVSKDNDADFFLSLHFNGLAACNQANPNGLRGTEIYIQPNSNANFNYDDDKEFAQFVLSRTLESFSQPKDRGIKERSFYRLGDAVLGSTRESPVLAALLEIESISSNYDVDWFFDDPAKRDRVAEKIALAIRDAREHFFGPPDFTRPSITFSNAGPSSVIQDGQLTIDWRATDNAGGSGLDHFGFFLERNGTPFDTNGYVAGLDSSEHDGRLFHGAAIYDPSATSYVWRVPGNLPAGSNYRVRMVAVDKAGNYSAFAYTNTFSVTAQSGPQPLVQTNDPSITEGDSGQKTVSFNVSLSASSSQAVTVQYRTVDGSGRANIDYVPASNATITIPAGQTLRTIPIQIIGNRTVEPDKTFYVELLGVTTANALLDKRSGRCTITNDDQPVRIGARIDGTTVTEGNSGTVNATVRVTLSEPAVQSVNVGWYTVEDSAVAGSDYNAASGTLNFAAGERIKDLTITVKGDTLAEPQEVFYVRLRNPSAGLSIDNVSGTVTVLDDDRPTVAIVDSPRVTEGDASSRNADFTVRLSAPSSQTVTVNYTTINDTALAGTDYTSRSGTLTFNPNVTQMTVSVPVLGDTSVEPDETFTLVLSNPSNALLESGASSADATVVNDDRAALAQLSVTGVTIDEGDTGRRGAHSG